MTSITPAELRELRRVPSNRRARGPNRRTVTEGTIVAAVLSLLRIHPKIAWAQRMNTGAARIDQKRFIRFGFTGCSDILGQLVDGRTIALEVKTATGRVTGPQQAFLANVTRNHGLAAVVRSVTDADKLLMAEPMRTYAPLE